PQARQPSELPGLPHALPPSALPPSALPPSALPRQPATRSPARAQGSSRKKSSDTQGDTVAKRRFLTWAHSSPTAAFVVAAWWAAGAVVWFIGRPDADGSSVFIVCACICVPVWTVLGFERLRAKRTAGEPGGPGGPGGPA